MFTEAFFEKYERQGAFTPQMIYDTRVESAGIEKNGTATEAYNFAVEYKIFRNDGTFRDDILSDSSRRLYFRLTDEGGTLKIDSITY